MQINTSVIITAFSKTYHFLFILFFVCILSTSALSQDTASIRYVNAFKYLQSTQNFKESFKDIEIPGGEFCFYVSDTIMYLESYFQFFRDNVIKEEHALHDMKNHSDSMNILRSLSPLANSNLNLEQITVRKFKSWVIPSLHRLSGECAFPFSVHFMPISTNVLYVEVTSAPVNGLHNKSLLRQGGPYKPYIKFIFSFSPENEPTLLYSNMTFEGFGPVR